MKVIFLDIDGVLCTSRFIEWNTSYNNYSFDIECIKNLKEILDITGALIVVTSTWRLNRMLADLRSIFNVYGLGKYIVGKTSDLGFDVERGEEIKKYIEDTKHSTRHKVEKFIIIDDDSDMGELKQYLLQTDGDVGITEEIKHKAISMLS